LPVLRAEETENMDSPFKPIRPDATQTKDMSKGVDHGEVARRLKQEYIHGQKDSSIRALDSVNTLVRYLMKERLDLDEMLEQATRLIFTQFNIKEISIGLRTPPDGLFRYVKMHGMRGEVWEAHKRLSYTAEKLIDPRAYKHTVISPCTKLCLAEDNPYAEGEAFTYSEHLMSISKRRAPDNSIEGDYLDVFIHGPNNEILGWIETGGTWDNKIPDARTIRCLEIVASVLGIAITGRNAMTGQRASPPSRPERPNPR
jgi:hypothetical protein